jgi:hypothetical protein
LRTSVSTDIEEGASLAIASPHHEHALLTDRDDQEITGMWNLVGAANADPHGREETLLLGGEDCRVVEVATG